MQMIPRTIRTWWLLKAVICCIFTALIMFITIDIVQQQDTSVFTIEERATNPILVWYMNPGDQPLPSWLPAYLSPTTINCNLSKKVVQCDFFRPSTTRKVQGYLIYGPMMDNLPLPRDPKTIWGLVHEDTINRNRQLMFEEVLNLFNFSATYSRYSDVPMPLFYLKSSENVTNKKYFVKTAHKNLLLSEIAPVLYIQSHCNSSTKRDDYVKKLMEYIRIDSYGNCLKNKPWPYSRFFAHTSGNLEYLRHLFDDEIMRFIARYKFVLAVENAVCNDYVTEKFWRAIYLGVVPIYFGDPLIKDWLPNSNSAILLQDFPTPELLSKHIYELLKNDTKYEEYLEHKIKGFISNRRIIDELKVRPNQANITTSIEKIVCLVCQRIHDKNNSQVNIVTKMHLNCPYPSTALTLPVSPNSKAVEERRQHKDNFHFQ